MSQFAGLKIERNPKNPPPLLLPLPPPPDPFAVWHVPVRIWVGVQAVEVVPDDPEDDEL
ncbi:MAG: hypothetical protein K6V73_06380 [Firmicutes bacterium]|nr:hypothetical protein [Bacillota bacterium]